MALSKRLAEAVTIFQARNEGSSVLVAESDMNRIATLAQQAFEIKRGKIIGTLDIRKTHTRVSKSKTIPTKRQD